MLAQVNFIYFEIQQSELTNLNLSWELQLYLPHNTTDIDPLLLHFFKSSLEVHFLALFRRNGPFITITQEPAGFGMYLSI